MGHKTIQMTVRYAHLAPEYQMAAVERLSLGGLQSATATRIDIAQNFTEESSSAIVQ